ncbi:WXG100 family type VII secretion target [Corynebacterium suicordis]|uniref:ESAT-6-like protein n=1 Tax=Corynebacterium suicordis DSM 45110 TaxID=1121369 RepID=A0ABR9ZHK9_9CORY|nr:WXG100 family type VII secretion target [Corynebacterium suicordis]MBF4552932.1 WXG100 family type VII secretion target [Corynebacterium suicordis DSM 45110]MDR6278108.1 WXG100 family type VII secretion target [Corynebacterium suicordis]
MSFKTDVQTMNTAASNVDRVNADVQGELRRLQGVVDDIAASWKGEAQNSFAGLMQRWNDNARDLQDALNSIAENLRANASGFDEAEAQNVSAFNN